MVSLQPNIEGNLCMFGGKSDLFPLDMIHTRYATWEDSGEKFILKNVCRPYSESSPTTEFWLKRMEIQQVSSVYIYYECFTVTTEFHMKTSKAI